MLLILATILAQEPLTTSPEAPSVVAEFFKELIAGDVTAYSKLSPDATMGINDVAMPMNQDSLLPFFKDCRFIKAESARPTALAGQTRVDATLTCSTKGKIYPMLVIVSVSGSSITSAYIR